MPHAAAPDRNDFWSPDYTYVIGHQRPDTDAIAAALGYAWLLSETGGTTVHASRAGQPGEQAMYALRRFEQAMPSLLAAVAPMFWHVADPRIPAAPDAPLDAALARLGEGEQIVPIVDLDGKPRGVVTPLGLARAFSKSLLAGARGRGKPGVTCGDIAEQVPVFQTRERVSDHRNALLRSDSHQFLVVDEHGRYVGIANQRHLLQPPRARLILVDHNELSQAVAGADEAEIIGVLDHHRLGNPPTAAPIPFTVDPVGSTSTLVAEHCRAVRKTPPRPIAGMLLSGILSDTLVFRSPTTDPRDRAAADWLGNVCRIDVMLYGEELLYASPGLGSRSADAIIDGDRKAYEMGSAQVSISQVEVTSLQELPARRDEILKALEERRVKESLDIICLMVTDVVMGRSHLMVRGEARLVSALPFSRVGDGEFELNDIVSRKKQLAPTLQSAIETTF